MQESLIQVESQGSVTLRQNLFDQNGKYIQNQINFEFIWKKNTLY